MTDCSTSYIRGGEGPAKGTGEQGDETRTRGQGGTKAWLGWNWKGLEETSGSETATRKGNFEHQHPQPMYPREFLCLYNMYTVS